MGARGGKCVRCSTRKRLASAASGMRRHACEPSASQLELTLLFRRSCAPERPQPAQMEALGARQTMGPARASLSRALRCVGLGSNSATRGSGTLAGLLRLAQPRRSGALGRAQHGAFSTRSPTQVAAAAADVEAQPQQAAPAAAAAANGNGVYQSQVWREAWPACLPHQC